MSNAYDPSNSILAGMSTDTLRTQLAALQAAYLALSSGSKAETVSYDQGGGAKSVTYTRANIAQLVAAIRLVQSQLGIIANPRRPTRLAF